jgi:hypothetical protein
MGAEPASAAEPAGPAAVPTRSGIHARRMASGKQFDRAAIEVRVLGASQDLG